MLDQFEKMTEATAAIRNVWKETPQVGIILGTGLGGLAEQIEIQASFDYESIPNFPCSTATSHRGRLVCTMAFQGRRSGTMPVIDGLGRPSYERFTLHKSNVGPAAHF